MATVRVGCKLPNGLIMELIEVPEGSTDPKRVVRMPAPAGERVFLKGSNSTHVDPKENPIAARFAFTMVDKDFALEWFERNKDALFVKNGSVFMEESAADAKAAAKDRAKETTGLEPLNPEKDPRTPKGVKPDKDQLKRLGVA